MSKDTKKRRAKGTGSIKYLGGNRYRLRVAVGTYADGTTRQKQMTVKAKSRADALLQLERLNAEYEEARQKSDTYTLGDYYERVVWPSKANTTRANRDGYVTAWAHIPNAWKNEELRDLTQTEVQAWINKMSRGTGKATVKYLRSILRQAYGDGLLDRYPMDVKYKYPSGSSNKTVWNVEQMATAMCAVRGLDIEPYMLIGLGTGARREELLALRWENIEVNRVGRTVTVWVDIHKAHTEKDGIKGTKTEQSERMVPIVGRIAERIAELHRGSGCVQTNGHGDYLKVSGLRRRWTNLWRPGGKVRKHVVRPDGALLAAGIPAISPNHLRHTHTTFMRDACKVDSEISNLFHGHLPESVEENHYAASHDARFLQAARVTANMLDPWIDYIEAGLEH